MSSDENIDADAIIAALRAEETGGEGAADWLAGEPMDPSAVSPEPLPTVPASRSCTTEPER